MVGEEWSERCRHLSQCLATATATGFHTVYTHIEEVHVHNHSCLQRMLYDGGAWSTGCTQVASFTLSHHTNSHRLPHTINV